MAAKRDLSAAALCAVLLAFLAASADARGGAIFQPAGLQTFDGTSWCGLTFGATTMRDVQKQYRTERGAYGNGRLLTQAAGAPNIIHTLFDSRSDKARLTGFVLYCHAGFERDALSQAAGEPGEPRYPSQRYEDWYVLAFPKRGLVAQVVQGEIRLVLLLPPAALAEGLTMSAAPTPVLPRVDSGAGKPRVMEFGTVAVSFKLDGITMDEAKERSSIERSMRSATAGGTMRYREGASGSYTTTISGGYDAKRGGMINIDCRIQGPGPYGPLSATSGTYAMLPKQGALAGSLQYTVKLLEARRNVEKEFEKEMHSQGPPPISRYREADWEKTVTALRAAADHAFRPVSDTKRSEK